MRIIALEDHEALVLFDFLQREVETIIDKARSDTMQQCDPEGTFLIGVRL